LTTKSINQQNSLTSETLNDDIIEAIRDLKGKNIVKLDLRKLHDASVDFFIICEGSSNTQVRAISDNIQKALKVKHNFYPSRVEGGTGSQWVLVDYFSTVVHIFYPETRAFYELEELWNDAQITTYHDL
jgi:ribosome-associated protein